MVSKLAVSHYSDRWAVKEATFKAFQRYRVLFPEIYTLRQSQSNDCAGSDARHVQTKLPIAADSKALGLAFCGETQALAEQLQIVVRSLFHVESWWLAADLYLYQDAHVSLSHDKDYAIAYVLVHQLQSQAS